MTAAGLDLVRGLRCARGLISFRGRCSRLWIGTRSETLTHTGLRDSTGEIVNSHENRRRQRSPWFRGQRKNPRSARRAWPRRSRFRTRKLTERRLSRLCRPRSPPTVSSRTGRSRHPDLRHGHGHVHRRQQISRHSRRPLPRRSDGRNEPAAQRRERAVPFGRPVGDRLVNRMVEIWLKTEFEGGRHARRLEKIAQYEGQTAAQAPPKANP